MQNLPIMADRAVARVDALGYDLRFFPALTSSRQVAQDVALRHTLQEDDRAFFVVDCGQVVRQWRRWQWLLPRVQVFYAVKCNNDPMLLRLLASLGANFDCASRNEIDQILSLDVDANRIVYANPCKTKNYIRHAKACDVNLMTFDNVDELHKIKALHPDAQLLLRIRLDSDISAQCPLNVKFGCEPETAGPLLLRTALEMNQAVVGVAFHVGSGCRDAGAYAQAIAHARRLFDIGRSMGHKMDLLDIGGGYPGFDSEIITFDDIAQVVNASLDEHFPMDLDVRVIAEPGRYFAAAAYTLCCNVMAKTRVPASRITGEDDDDFVDGFMYYINDGVYGSFNCILYDHFHPTGQALFPTHKQHTWASVWGPTCDGLDQVQGKCRLPVLAEGDWLLFDNMGAYTAAAGSEFNGFPRPTVYYHVTEEEWDAIEPLLGKTECERIRTESEGSWQSSICWSLNSLSSTCSA